MASAALPRLVEEQLLEAQAKERGPLARGRDHGGATEPLEQVRGALEAVDRVALDLDEGDGTGGERRVGKADGVGAVLPPLIVEPPAVPDVVGQKTARVALAATQDPADGRLERGRERLA